MSEGGKAREGARQMELVLNTVKRCCCGGGCAGGTHTHLRYGLCEGVRKVRERARS